VCTFGTITQSTEFCKCVFDERICFVRMECSRCNNFLDVGNGEGVQGKGATNQRNVCKNYGGIGLLNSVERIEKIMEFFFSCQTQLIFSITCIGYMFWIN
jgi:hypothetical protein